MSLESTIQTISKVLNFVDKVVDFLIRLLDGVKKQ